MLWRLTNRRIIIIIISAATDSTWCGIVQLKLPPQSIAECASAIIIKVGLHNVIMARSIDLDTVASVFYRASAY